MNKGKRKKFDKLSFVGPRLPNFSEGGDVLLVKSRKHHFTYHGFGKIQPGQ